MNRPTVLGEAEIVQGLAKLDGWAREGNRIVKRYRFAGFPEAIAFMVRGALAAERLDHHPSWTNEHARVEVRLTTHRAADGAGITSLDFELARVLDEAA